MKKSVRTILTGLALVGLGTLVYKNKETISKESKALKTKVQEKKNIIKKEAVEALKELSDDCVCKDCPCETKSECLANCQCSCCE